MTFLVSDNPNGDLPSPKALQPLMSPISNDKGLNLKNLAPLSPTSTIQPITSTAQQDFKPFLHHPPAPLIST